MLRGISISQYRIDWRLRDAGIECTPENRIACALGCDWIESSQQLHTTINYRLYPWVQDVLKRGKALECDGMDLQTRLECPDWAWPGLKNAFPRKDSLSRELKVKTYYRVFLFNNSLLIKTYHTMINQHFILNNRHCSGLHRLTCG